MLKTSLISGSIILVLIYIGFGDQIQVLPENMRNSSTQARTKIIEFGANLVPDWVKKTQENRDDREDILEEELQEN